LRYRIPRGEYELPDDISFSPAETALLGLAAMVWREGSLSGESRRALLKLRSVGDTADEPVPGYAPRLRLGDTAFEPLSAALERRVITRFPYLKPGQQTARDREVIPLALVQYQGRWHLYAEELATGDEKMFLLRRIVGAVTTGKPAPERPGDHTARAFASLDRVWNSGVAVVTVAPGSDAATRLANRRGAETLASGELQLHFVDLDILADDLAGFGPEVVVVSPPALRDAVITRLERIVADHG
ncbi:MAG: WYL domain-containing protein, partial [Microbacteriaceae bacterium]